MRRFLLLGLLALVCSAVGSATGAEASPSIDYGLQDDAWLAYGEGSVQDRVASLEQAGVGIVRFNLRWDQVERVRGTFDWTIPDRVLDALQAAGLPALVTLYGAPRWANGGRAPNWAPLSGSTFGRFARIAAIRYSWVRDWLIWNEPNKAQFLRPTSPSVYVSRLLNPAYTAIHLASRRAKVGGGATAPRAGAGEFLRSRSCAGCGQRTRASTPTPTTRIPRRAQRRPGAAAAASARR